MNANYLVVDDQCNVESFELKSDAIKYANDRNLRVYCVSEFSTGEIESQTLNNLLLEVGESNLFTHSIERIQKLISKEIEKINE